MKIQYTFLFLLLICSMGCLDEIDLETEPGEPILVVSGQINNGARPYTVKLSKSAEFSSGIEGIPDAVTDAEVRLFDDLGNVELLTQTEDGTYQTAIDGMQGTIGRSYNLEISYQGINYVSRPELLRPVVSPESLEIELIDEERINEAGNFVNIERVQVLVNTPMPANQETSYLKWNAFGVYEYPEIGSSSNLNPDICYVTEKIDFDNVAVVSSEDVSGDFLQRQPVISRDITYRFSRRYCFYVIQQSITAEAFEFWEKVGAEFERTGDIFETPPSKIRGNIYNPEDLNEQVAGYFSASAIDTTQLLVLADEVGTPSPQCVPFPPGPPSCYDCANVLPNSTLIKPECWE